METERDSSPNEIIVNEKPTFSERIRIFFSIYKYEILLFTIWAICNIIIFIWKFFEIKAKCNGVDKGDFILIGEVKENRPCQASYGSCCKPYPYPNGPNLDPHFKPCTPTCDDACNLLGRVTGHLLNFNLALTLFPILRNTIWTKAFKVFPFERSVFFHRWIGLFIFVVMLFHMITWWIAQQFPSPGFVCWAFTMNFRSDQFNGQLAFLFHAVSAFFALEYFRRRYFELFYYTHFLYVGLFAFAVYHTAGVQGYMGWEFILSFKDDYFIYYLAIPFMMYIVDRIVRFYKSNLVETKLVHMEAHLNTKVTKLLVQRKHFKFDSGQYCFINIPEISRLEWHPFSVSSSPESPQVFSFHIKDMGNKTWTHKLYSIAVQNSTKLKIKIDGPYGAKSLQPEDYRVNVLFCGGVGSTPMISILSEIMDRNLYFSQKVQRVYFNWVIKEPELMTWYSDIWEGVFHKATSNVVKIGHIEFVFTFHITQNKQASFKNVQDDKENVPLLSAISHMSFLSNIPAKCFENGRPDVPNVLRKIRDENPKAEKIAIFGCGPKEMTDELSVQSKAQSNATTKFDFHQETFFL